MAKGKKKSSIIKASLIIVAILFIIGVSTPTLLKNLNFGLDLQGGFEVLYKIESANDGEKLTSDMVNNTYKTITKRIDVLGVSEPEITIEGDDKIRVQLAGVTDPETARNTLSKVASLSFRDSNDVLLMDSSVLKSGGAKPGTDEKGKPCISLSIANKDKFYEVTSKISSAENNLIVIWLDYNSATDKYRNEGKACGTNGSNCLSAATVSQGFSSDVIITGNFTTDEVNNLVELINSGSLPTKLEEISSNTVDASFGADSLGKTAKAGVIGIVAIMAIMIIIYHFAGFVASVGMTIYTFLVFLFFWLFGGVLTLPGIAALVIGIGMAIDSCVISFSRIKDELKNNVSLEGAVRKGNKNSFMSIFDSNITTLLVAFILFIFGTSSVKGFATMLIISTIVTMVVMVFLTRSLLNLFIKTGLFDKKLNLFIGYKERKERKERKEINFVKLRKVSYIYILVIVAIGIIGFATKGLNLGIDFKGGSSIDVIGKSLNVDKVSETINGLDYNVYNKQTVDDDHIIIKINETLNKEEIQNITEVITENYEDSSTNIGVISNIVKKDLVKNAIFAILLASLGIILYISVRFKFSYAVSAIIALIHDVGIIFVVFSIFGIEVQSIFVAAILSIIGYSINDTIVTFDRIRENLRNDKDGKIKDEEELAGIVNRSLNATLGRSIITTITTLCPVIALIAFGSHDIIYFNIALLIGLIAGVLSSIFIASQLWFDIEKKQIGKPIKKKWYEEEDKPVKKNKEGKKNK